MEVSIWVFEEKGQHFVVVEGVGDVELL